MRFVNNMNTLINIRTLFSGLLVLMCLFAAQVNATQKQEVAWNKTLDSAYQELFKDPAKVRDYLQQKNIEQLHTDTLLAKYYNLIGITYGVLLMSEDAIENFKSAMMQLPSEHRMQMRIMQNLANAYRNHADYKNAFDVYYKAKNLAKEYNDIKMLAQIKSELATCYTFLNRHDFAIKYSEEAIDLLQKLELADKTPLYLAYQKLAYLFYTQGNEDLAMLNYELATSGLRNSYRKDALYFSMVHMAPLMIESKGKDYVRQLLDTAYQGFISTHQEYNLPFVHARYALMHDMVGEQDSCVYHYNKAALGVENNKNPITLTIQLEYAYLLQKYKRFNVLDSVLQSISDYINEHEIGLAERYSYLQIEADRQARIGNYKKAFELNEQIKLLTDSMNMKNNEYAFHGLESRYQALEMENLKTLLLKEKDLRKKRALYYIIVLLALVLVFVVMFRLKLHKNRSLELEKKQLLIELNERFDQLSSEKSRVDALIENEGKFDLKHVLQNPLDLSSDELRNPEAPYELAVNLLLKMKASNPEWIAKLRNFAPEISDGDIEFCLLLRYGLRSKEIAQILGVNASSVHTRKYRLSKKLQLDGDENLNTWLLQLE